MSEKLPFEDGPATVERNEDAYFPVDASEVHEGVYIDKSSRSPFIEVEPRPRTKAGNKAARLAMEGFVTPPKSRQ